MSKKVSTGQLFVTAADESVGMMSTENRIIEQESVRMRFGRDGMVSIAGCSGGAWGLDVPESISIETIESVSETMLSMADRLNLWVGDLLAAAERLDYGDIAGWASKLNYDEKTLRNWKYICNKVQASLRKDIHDNIVGPKPLTMGHYNLVAPMPEYEQRHYLSEALKKGWSVATLHRAIHGSGKKRTHLERAQPYLDRISSTMDGAPPPDRAQMATALRALADELEG